MYIVAYILLFNPIKRGSKESFKPVHAFFSPHIACKNPECWTIWRKAMSREHSILWLPDHAKNDKVLFQALNESCELDIFSLNCFKLFTSEQRYRSGCVFNSSSLAHWAVSTNLTVHSTHSAGLTLPEATPYLKVAEQIFWTDLTKVTIHSYRCRQQIATCNAKLSRPNPCFIIIPWNWWVDPHLACANWT